MSYRLNSFQIWLNYIPYMMAYLIHTKCISSILIWLKLIPYMVVYLIHAKRISAIMIRLKHIPHMSLLHAFWHSCRTPIRIYPIQWYRQWILKTSALTRAKSRGAGMEILPIVPFGWFHQIKQYMQKMHFKQHVEQDVSACVLASKFIDKKSCSGKILDKTS